MVKWFLLALAPLVVATSDAAAKRRDASTCTLVEAGFVTVDGMIDDWRGVRPARVSGGPNASFKLRCAYDRDKLYLSVDVNDDKLIRTRAAKVSAEDHLEISLRGTGKPIRVLVLPGALTAKRKIIAGRRQPSWLQVEDSLQPKGFSVEVSLPRTKIPGIGKNTPIIFADVRYHDTDKATAYKIQRVRSYSGVIYTAEGARTHRAFLKTLKLRGGDLRLDRLADVDTVRGAERVVAGDRYVGVLSDTFAFMQLPVQSAQDVIKLQLVDFDGDGRSFLLGQYRQHGGGGSREVVSVWEFKGDGSFRQVVGFEVAKTLGESSLRSTWTLVERGALRKLRKGERRRGFDLLVEAGQAKGFDSSSWNETPAKDVHPILLPWSDDKVSLYQFDSNVGQMVVPDSRKLARWRKRRR